MNDSLQSRTIEWLRFAMAATVVLQHTWFLEPLSACRESLIPTIFSQGLCRVAVPVIFFISGYLFFTGLSDWNWGKWTGKIKKRVRTLLVPYLLWNLIAFGAQAARIIIKKLPTTIGELYSQRGGLLMFWNDGRFGQDAVSNILGYSIQVGTPIDNPLWFIRDLMVLCLISPAIYFLLKKAGKLVLPLVGVLMTLSIWLPFEGCSAAAFFFFSAGGLLQIKGKDIVETFAKFKYPSYILSALFFIAATLTYSKNAIASGCLMNLFTITGACAMFNIAASLLSAGIVKVHPKLSNSSFFIYALHMATVLSFFGTAVCKILPPSNGLLLNIDYFLIFVITTAFCLGVYCIMDKICPRLLGILTGGR